MGRSRELAEFASAYDGGSPLGFKNRIINGDMRIDQRNAGALVSLGNAGAYTTDRWYTGWISGATYTVQQVADAPTGFKYSLKWTATSSSSVNDLNVLGQNIEGNNVSDLEWGTSSGTAVTFTVWVKSNVTGQHNGAVIYYGGGATYYYLPTYTVNAANTWEQKTLTIPAPPTAAGAFTNALNSTYVIVRASCMTTSGTSTQAGNTWSTSSVGKATGSISLAGTSGNFIQITGVQLEAGSVATPFERRDYGRELMMCQRYYYRRNFYNGQYVANLQVYGAGSAFGVITPLPVTMRTTPTANLSAIGSFAPNNAGGGAPVAFTTGTLAASTTADQIGTGGFGGASGLVSGNASILTTNAVAWIDASAEL